MSPLCVIVVRDGRPGHEKQSFGLIAALKSHCNIEIREVKVQPGVRSVLMALSILFGFASQKWSDFRPDLIIGAGSHTHCTILALKRRLGGRAIVCMSPMALFRGQFDLCCIPRHDRVAEGANVFLTDGPPGLNRDLRQHDPGVALVLVGGIDEKSHVWESAAIARQIITTIAAHPELTWTLTTSPRTPADFLGIFAQYQLDIAVTLRPFGSTPQGWLEEQLQQAQWVVVTEDSISMIFEALSAGCHVSTIPVNFIAENKFVWCLKDLKLKHYIATSVGGVGLNKQQPLNEAERCAFEIMKRFFVEQEKKS